MTFFSRAKSTVLQVKSIFVFACLSVLVYVGYLGVFGVPEYLTEKVHKYEYFYKLGIPQLNQHLYPYVISNEHKCQTAKGTSDDISLLLLVKSSVDHFDRRKAIRQTWGWEHRFPEVSIRRIFSLGVTTDKETMSKVQYEHHVYGDIVQSKFVDNSNNTTINIIVGMLWVLQQCHNCQYVLFVNDDYYVSVKNVMQFLKYTRGYYPEVSVPVSDDSEDGRQNTETPSLDLLAGYVHFNITLQRNESDKWYVSEAAYPYEIYPPFIATGAMLMSLHTVRTLYYASLYTPLLPLEETYIGVVAAKAGVLPLHSDHFHNEKTDNPRELKYTIAAPGYRNTSDLIQLWWKQFKLEQA